MIKIKKIILLDNKTIEKIAAGEVIERPSSIIKELIENSIDANAKNITVEIRNGGKSYIRITDDGVGIDYEDIDIAFKRYSTSKLSSAEDLYKIKSLGFRGEALASISQVSKIEMMTKREDALGGTHVIVEEGEIISKEIIGCPKGTTMIVKDLFYSFPVRKEFLKTDLIESNHISDILYRIAIGNLNISFKYIKDDKVILKTSRNNNMKSHIYSILGKEFSNNIIEINNDNCGIHIHGYISNNNLYRSNRNHQYIYVNGRYVNDSIISNVIENHYKTLIPINRFPCFILFIELDPSTIDVNIHPTKQEIKFANQSTVFSMIDEAVKYALFSSLSIPKIEINEDKKIKEEKLPLLFDLPSINIDNKELEDKKKDIVIKDFTTKPILEDKILVKEDCIEEQLFQGNCSDKNTSNINIVLSNIEPIGILFNTYILAEDILAERIYFIDQHAAHERVMYEKYLQEYKNENIIMQQLLIPEIIELTNLEMNIFLDNISIFNSLGFDIEEFGNNSVVLRSVPMIFGKPTNIRVLFYDILDNINSIKSNYDTKIEKIMKIACTKAIKSGDKITKVEIFSLIEQLKKCINPHTCPHGRPIILEMTKVDLEKAFLRII